jgi:peptidyl-prolyl cis-trans isomerase B (cyclophilin B)
MRHVHLLALTFSLLLPALPAFSDQTATAQTVNASTPRAIIEMKKGGRIEIVFFPADAPNTVENFIKLAKKGFYNGLVFHRVEPGILVQGGDPLGNGYGGPGYTIKAEFNSQPHVPGTLAMARSGNDPDSAGSQFYICIAPLPALDNKYTVFGRVTSGMEIVQKIQVGDKIKKIKILK